MIACCFLVCLQQLPALLNNNAISTRFRLLFCVFSNDYRNDCINCHTKFGEYHCETCNLWMSNDENPYHCSDCGFCRIGGDDAFVHCHDCEMCVYASQFEKHDCKKDKYKSNCPICQECMFDSRKKTHEMPCGHALHWDCFLELTKHDSRCPLCKKTAESEKRMAATWKFMALNIVFNPIPCEMAKVVDIYCNDCETHQSNRPWHPVGIQCQSCVSFNTFIEKVTATGPASHSFLQNQESM
jgi:RING finger/CHY zinc finger protein 1